MVFDIEILDWYICPRIRIFSTRRFFEMVFRSVEFQGNRICPFSLVCLKCNRLIPDCNLLNEKSIHTFVSNTKRPFGRLTIAICLKFELQKIRHSVHLWIHVRTSVLDKFLFLRFSLLEKGFARSRAFLATLILSRSSRLGNVSIPLSHSFLIGRGRQWHLLLFHAGTHMTRHVGTARGVSSCLGVARDTTTFWRPTRGKSGGHRTLHCETNRRCDPFRNERQRDLPTVRVIGTILGQSLGWRRLTIAVSNYSDLLSSNPSACTARIETFKILCTYLSHWLRGRII